MPQIGQVTGALLAAACGYPPSRPWQGASNTRPGDPLAADGAASELPRPVDVGAVFDGHDVDAAVLVIDAVYHPVVPPTERQAWSQVSLGNEDHLVRARGTVRHTVDAVRSQGSLGRQDPGRPPDLRQRHPVAIRPVQTFRPSATSAAIRGTGTEQKIWP